MAGEQVLPDPTYPWPITWAGVVRIAMREVKDKMGNIDHSLTILQATVQMQQQTAPRR